MKRLLFLGFLASLIAPSALADAPSPMLVLVGHKFLPTEIHVKANQANVITLVNKDDTAEEFDSTALKVEKVVDGHDQGDVRIRPLSPGRYTFMGEFHSATAQGVVIAE
jgi:hypothetical protein